MIEVPRRRALSLCDASTLKRLHSVPVETAPLIKNDSSSIHKPQLFFRAPASFSGNNANTLYELAYQAEYISSVNRSKHFEEHQRSFERDLDVLNPLPAVRKLGVGASQAPRNISVASFDESRKHSLQNPSINVSASEPVCDSSFSGFYKKKISAPLIAYSNELLGSKGSTLLTSRLLMKYLALVTENQPYSGLAGNDYSEEPGAQSTPESYMHFSGSSRTVSNQFIKHFGEPFGLSGSTKTNGSDCERIVPESDEDISIIKKLTCTSERLQITKGSDITVLSPPQLEKLSSEAKVEELRHMFKDLERKHRTGSRHLSCCLTGASTPTYTKEDALSWKGSSEHGSMNNLSRERSETPRSRKNSSIFSRNRFLASPLPHDSQLLNRSVKSTEKKSVELKPKSDAILFGSKQTSTGRRISGQEMNFMAPTSF